MKRPSGLTKSTMSVAAGADDHASGSETVKEVWDPLYQKLDVLARVMSGIGEVGGDFGHATGY